MSTLAEQFNQRGAGALPGHLGTALEGTIECVARPAHLGRTTQVWDATVTHRETGKTIALFRCTQMVLYPKAAG
jgi:uncharacterized protein (TIGR00369 family)